MDNFWLYTTRILVIVLSLIGGISFIIFAAPLMQALVIAALLAYLLAPVVRLLHQRTRLNWRWAVGLVYSLFLLLLAGVPAGLGAVAVNQYYRLERAFLEALPALQTWLGQPVALLGFRLFPQDLVNYMSQSITTTMSTLPTDPLNLLSGVTTNFLWGAVILVSLYYFLQDGPAIKPSLVRLVAPIYQAEIQNLLDEIDRVWSLFLRIQLLIFLILAILMILGTLLVIWLFQTGLIPFSPLALILLLLLVYTLAQQVDNLWLRPQLLGRKLRLHPGVAFVGLLGGIALSGVLGALLALPTLATLKVVGEYVHRKIMSPHLNRSAETSQDVQATATDANPKPTLRNEH